MTITLLWLQENNVSVLHTIWQFVISNDACQRKVDQRFVEVDVVHMFVDPKVFPGERDSHNDRPNYCVLTITIVI